MILVALAQAATVEIVGGEDRTDTDRLASLAGGAGVSFVAGRNGSAMGAALAERVALSLAIGEVSAIAVELDHARHEVVDGARFFDLEAAPGGVTGWRDYLALEAGGRIGLVIERRPGTRVHPWLWLGVGVVFTGTEVVVPAFTGTADIRTRAAAPIASLGFGAAVRILDWLSVQPAFKTQFLVAPDPGEVDGKEVWGLEARMQPAVDVSLDF